MPADIVSGLVFATLFLSGLGCLLFAAGRLDQPHRPARALRRVSPGGSHASRQPRSEQQQCTQEH
jgi:hypothetical protein